MPIRIQRKRTRGWKMPEGAVYVGRPTRWGNPYVIGKNGTAEECVRRYIDDMLPYTHLGKRNTMTDFMLSESNLSEIKAALRGKDLACWCPLGQACHANWLLEMANQPGDEAP